jgi:hypothetical protein
MRLYRYEQIVEKNEDNVIKVNFSKELIDIFRKLEDENSFVAFELMWFSEAPTEKYKNSLNIENVEISKTDNSFLVTINDKKQDMFITNFLNFYFGKNYFGYTELRDFLDGYKILSNGGEIKPKIKIEIPKFSYNPKDVKNTFLSLVTKTYPHGHEKEVLQFLPKLNVDIVGNYYIIIGDNQKPETMFTSHLDTADRVQGVTSLLSYEDSDGNEIIHTDGTTILGADDKAGVTVMLYMISHNVTGLYYFFIGEERGGIGSHALSSEFDKVEYLKNVKRCISFDRRKTISVITSQMGGICCSDTFGNALCEEYNSNGLNLSLDPTGVYTDSASFIDQIPECTNISVGYNNEHTVREIQNITYLEKLAEASVKVKWDSLPTSRKVGLDDDLKIRFKSLIEDIKESFFELEVKITPYLKGIAIVVEVYDEPINDTYETMNSIEFVLRRHNLEPKVYFEKEFIKIYIQ